MEIGFSVEAAKPKGRDHEDAPTHAPMAPRGPDRRSPSTDQIKVRRQMAKSAGAADQIEAMLAGLEPPQLQELWDLATAEQAKTTDRKTQDAIATVRGAIMRKFQAWGMEPTMASKTAASDFSGGGMLHALWIKIMEWIVGHNGYGDYADEYAFASLKESSSMDKTLDQQIGEKLAAMASAPLAEQRKLAEEVASLRQQRTAAIQAEREIDLGAQDYVTTMPFVAHTTATDWLGEDGGADLMEVQRSMAAHASKWYLSTHASVRADEGEFQIQARGMANSLAGAHAPHMQAASDAFVRHALFLNRGGAQAVASLHTAKPGDTLSYSVVPVNDAGEQDIINPNRPGWQDKARFAHGPFNTEAEAEAKRVELEAGGVMGGGKWKVIPNVELDPLTASKTASIVTPAHGAPWITMARTAGDATADPTKPWSEPAGTVSEDDKVVGEVIIEDPPEDVPFDNFAAPIAPENAAAVAQEGERTPMTGAGEGDSKSATAKTASISWTENTAPSGRTYYSAQVGGYNLDIRPLTAEEAGEEGVWGWSVTGDGAGGPKNRHGQAMNRKDAEHFVETNVASGTNISLESGRKTAVQRATVDLGPGLGVKEIEGPWDVSFDAHYNQWSVYGLMDGLVTSIFSSPDKGEVDAFVAAHPMVNPDAGQQGTLASIHTAAKCSNCTNGNHSGTNGTAGCKGGSCSCSCNSKEAARHTAAGAGDTCPRCQKGTLNQEGGEPLYGTPMPPYLHCDYCWASFDMEGNLTRTHSSKTAVSDADKAKIMAPGSQEISRDEAEKIAQAGNDGSGRSLFYAYWQGQIVGIKSQYYWDKYKDEAEFFWLGSGKGIWDSITQASKTAVSDADKAKIMAPGSQEISRDEAEKIAQAGNDGSGRSLFYAYWQGQIVGIKSQYYWDKYKDEAEFFWLGSGKGIWDSITQASKTAVRYTCNSCGATSTSRNKYDFKCDSCGSDDLKTAAIRPTAGVYCNTHQVWVGDGNAATHEGCSKEQKATDKTKEAAKTAGVSWTLTSEEPNWVTDDGDVATTPNGTIPMEYIAKVPEGELRVYNVIGGWLWQINGPNPNAAPIVEFNGANGDPFGPRDGLGLDEAKAAVEKAYKEWSSKTSAKTAGVYCNTHQVWVGDGNGGTCERCGGSGHRQASLVSVGGINLTNVGIVDKDGGICKGVDPSGKTVQFKVTPKEMSDLSSILYSDLAGNFSGVEIEEGDIVASAHRRTAGVYCNTHQVWVGDGNASTHEGCSKEQKATEKTSAKNICLACGRDMAEYGDGPCPANLGGNHRPATEKTADATPGKIEGEVKAGDPNNPAQMWPWELPEGDVKTGEGAANVAGVQTPGGDAGYPQVKTSVVDENGMYHRWDDPPRTPEQARRECEATSPPGLCSCGQHVFMDKSSTLVADPAKLSAFQARIAARRA